MFRKSEKQFKWINYWDLGACPQCGERINCCNNFCPECGMHLEILKLKSRQKSLVSELESVNKRIAELKRESGEIEE